MAISIDGFIPFQLKGDLDAFEQEYLALLKREYWISEQDARSLLTSIWLLANDQFKNGLTEGKNQGYSEGYNDAQKEAAKEIREHYHPNN